jgi:hypothetical protein
MKFFFIAFMFLNSISSHADVKVSTCRTLADMAKDIAILKANKKTEDEIRNFIFQKDDELRSEKNPYITKQNMDSILEERIEILIWLFDKKNQSLSPSQVYSKKFDECFKHLKSKGY